MGEAAHTGILVVDDDPDSLLLVKHYLSQLDVTLFFAHNGQEGVEQYLQHRPQLIFMDIVMPGLDGFHTTRQIRQQQDARDECAILFMTALQEEETLVQCLECGGDDFIAKPIKRTQLLARTKNWIKKVQLTTQVREQRDHLAFERRFVESTLERIRHSTRLDESNLRFLIDGLEQTAGDILLAAQRPDGVQQVLLGDFTGHGLPAALGAPLVSDIFYSMTSRGCGMAHILTEINTKLHNRLPTGMYLATAACEADHGRGQVKLWNAGTPDILIYEKHELKFRVPSSVIPLGITVDKSFLPVGHLYQSDYAKRVFLYSDGVTETQNSEGLFYGQETLERLIGQIIEFNEPLEMIRHFLTAYRGQSQQKDDVTLVELLCDPTLPLPYTQPHLIHPMGTNKEESDWILELSFGPDAIRCMDMIPQVMSILAIRNNLRQHFSSLYTIVRELITNAIDWGILELPAPSQNTKINGENHHLKARLTAMQRLEYGSIHLTIHHIHASMELDRPIHHGSVRIVVEDSGHGFDAHGVDFKANRGLGIVKKLCDNLVFPSQGNRVEATYRY
ncbi:fused response regulator/phosphatase [Magnetococcus sp. PR-3]|uniref:fused response regulator/phosphatase n=1 Tax=Magnetococcus sp. PR-3 TaxID=3120355 RepID=UPI002FCE0AAA